MTAHRLAHARRYRGGRWAAEHAGGMGAPIAAARGLEAHRGGLALERWERPDHGEGRAGEPGGGPPDRATPDERWQDA